MHYQTFDDSATVADQDYVAIPDTILQFAPNDMSKTITVKVNGDNKFKGNEAFKVFLSNPTNATLDLDIGTGTILNDDSVPPGAVTNPDVQISDGSAIEGANAVFTVSLSAPGDGRADRQFQHRQRHATGGTCPGADYVTQSGTLTFAVGDPTTQTITVVTCDNLTENPNKSFFVNLTDAWPTRPSSTARVRARSSTTRAARP